MDQPAAKTGEHPSLIYRSGCLTIVDTFRYVHAVTDAEVRVERLERQIEEILPHWSMTPVVEAVQAMRGVAFIVAVTVVAEVGDFSRFDNSRQLMAYLGLVPSEHSSGATVRRGGITKAGNALAADSD